jgi:eukaryotic-like serine/threonine-protein kinase
VLSGPLAAGLSPAIGSVYAGSDDGYLYALDTRNGRPRWRFRVSGPVSAGPVQDAEGGSVYVGDDNGHLYEVLSDGGGLWRFPASGAIGAIGATPVSDGGETMYVGSADSHIYAVAMGSGAQVWAYPAGSPVNSGLAFANNVLYAGNDAGYLVAIDTSSQRKLWQYQAGGPVRSQITVAGGVVYFGSADHHVYAVQA